MMRKINLALKFYFKNKFSKYNLILIAISVLIVLIVNIYSYSASNYLNNETFNNSVWLRSLQVIPNNNTLEEGIEKVMHISHVTNAIKYNFYDAILSSSDLKNEKLPGDVFFYFSNNNSLPKIVNGHNFPEEKGNYIICPKKLYSSSGLDSLQFINVKYVFDMANYLNKEIIFNYKSAYGTNEYSEKYKVIGLYTPNDVSESNICFIQNENLEKIVINQYSDYFDQETGKPILDMQYSILIQFDDVRNLPYIKSSLDELGYGYDDSSAVLYDYFEDINSSTYNITIITNIIIFILIFILLFKQFKEEKVLLKMLNIIGYKRNDIMCVTFISNIILIFLSIIISHFLFLIIFLLGKTILYYYPFILNGWEFSINYKSLFSVFYTLIILTIIISIIKYILIKREFK